MFHYATINKPPFFCLTHHSTHDLSSRNVFSSCTFLIHSFCSNFKQSKTLRLASCWIVQSLVRSFRILRSKIFEVMGLLQSRKKIMVFSITPKEQMKLTSEENAQDSEFCYVFEANITTIRIHPIHPLKDYHRVFLLS